MNIEFSQDYSYVIWPSIKSGPYTVNISATCPEEYNLDLCLYCSKSQPYELVKNKENIHLYPHHKFFDINNNITNSITVYPSSFLPIYNELGQQIAVSSSISFYIMDDMPTAPAPLYIHAELTLPKCSSEECCTTISPFTSSKSTAIIPIWINEWTPKYIKFTKDGKNDINDKWTTLPISWYATLHDNVQFLCEDNVYKNNPPIIFSYAPSSVNSNILNVLNVNSPNNTSSTCCVDEPKRFKRFDKKQNTGWLTGECNTSISALSAQISGSLFINYSASRVFQSPSVFIANPNNGHMTVMRRNPSILDSSIFFNQPLNEICNNNLTTEEFEGLSGTGGVFYNYSFPTPIVTDYTDSMGLTGFSGIYGVAVAKNYCPDGQLKDYIWATDAELDKIYKINYDGSIVKTIDLKYVDSQYSTTISTLSTTKTINTFNKSISATISFNTFKNINTYENCAFFNFNLIASGLYLNTFLDDINITCKQDNNILFSENWSKQEDYNKTIDYEFNSNQTNINILLTGTFVSEHDAIIMQTISLETLLPYNINNLFSCKDAGMTPAAIALDSDLNFWVSLFDTNKIYKFDKDGNFLFSVSAPPEPIPPYPYNTNQLAFDVQYKPSVVETDVDNNVWVAYNNTHYSELRKYNGQNGQDILTVNNFPSSSTPVDLLVDGFDNSVWVSMAYSHILNLSAGELRKYSTTGTLLSTVTGILYPSNITIDKQRRIWYIHEHSNVSFIDISGNKQSFNTFTNLINTPWSNVIDNSYVNGEQRLEGISCDHRNNLWIIDSVNNKGYGLNINLLGTPLSGFAIFNTSISPHNQLSWYNDDINGQYSINHNYTKSAQAFCDWTGYRWFQKYFSKYDSTNTINTIVSGTSNFFKINQFEPLFEIRRFNESWNITEQVRSYAIAPHINSYFAFWNNFIGGSIGGLEPGQQLGRTVYLNIANFVPFNIDVDVSNVKQLYSISQYLDVPIDNYNLSYPADIKKIIDIASISYSKLWGEITKCNLNITNQKICPRCNFKHSNLGEQINSPETYIVSAGKPIIVHNRFINGQYGWELLIPSYKKYVDGELKDALYVCSETLTNLCDIRVSCTNLISSYPLSSFLQTENYDIDFCGPYDFYEYIDGFPFYDGCDQLTNPIAQAAGVINWNDFWTTLNRNEVTLDDWYKDNGKLQTLIEYYLLKGLEVKSNCK